VYFPVLQIYSSILADIILHNSASIPLEFRLVLFQPLRGGAGSHELSNLGEYHGTVDSVTRTSKVAWFIPSLTKGSPITVVDGRFDNLSYPYRYVSTNGWLSTQDVRKQESFKKWRRAYEARKLNSGSSQP
jgi:hypothetical protein